MSGDLIKNLKMVKEQPLNLKDLEYTTKLLDPFDDIVVERFTTTANQSSSSKWFVLLAIVLVLIINFPKIREKSGLNEYIVWLISATILFGMAY